MRLSSLSKLLSFVFTLAAPVPGSAQSPPNTSPEAEQPTEPGPATMLEPASSRLETSTQAAPNASASDQASSPNAASEISDIVVVTGTRSSRLAGAVQLLGQEQLERTKYDDPHAILRQVPGVFLREEDGMGLRPNIAMRGVNPDRSKKITLLEDGILFGPAPYSAPAAYYFPLMPRITQVRVTKGPGAVAFGPQTVAGAVDFISRPVPVVPTLGGDLVYGERGYRQVRAHAGASSDQYGLLAEGVHIANAGFKQLPDGANTGAARSEAILKGFYVLDPEAWVSNELSFKLGYSREASNETYLGLTDADFDENPNRRLPASALDRMDNHRTMLQLTHELRSYESNYHVRTTVYRHDYYRSWRKFNRLGGVDASSVLADPTDPSNAGYYAVLTGEADTSNALEQIYIGPNERSFVSQGIQTRFRWEPSTGPLSHKLEIGARLHHDSIERDHTEDAFVMAGSELYPVDAPTLVTTRNYANTNAVALHAVDAITWQSWTLTPGVRVEGIVSSLEDRAGRTSDGAASNGALSDGARSEPTERSLVAVLPGVGAYYGILPSWGVFAGAYRGFSPPAPGSDDSESPEYSINYEAGTRYVQRDTHAELVGFFNDYQNLTDICTFSSGCVQSDIDQQFDAGRARIFGIEALARHTLRFGSVRLPLSAAYTLSHGEFRTTFDSADPIYGQVQAGDEIPYLPRHQFNASVAVEHDSFSFYALGTYVSRFREQAGSAPLSQALSTDPLITFDLGLSAPVLPYLELYVNARNLLDYQGIMAHRPYGARPNAPRWIQAGVKLDLEM